mgnify:CR=1 FL=1
MAEIDREFWKVAAWVADLEESSRTEHWLEHWQTASPDEIEFESTDQIYYAASLLRDGQLPAAASSALGSLMHQVISEAHANRVKIESLHIVPIKGRPEDKIWKASIVYRVSRMLFNGHSAEEAYELVAQHSYRSPETIRRLCERAAKEYREQHGGK